MGAETVKVSLPQCIKLHSYGVSFSQQMSSYLNSTEGIHVFIENKML